MSNHLKVLKPKSSAEASPKASPPQLSIPSSPSQSPGSSQTMGWIASWIVWPLRLLILGIGGAAITGTILATLFPQSKTTPIAHLTSTTTLQSLVSGKFKQFPSTPNTNPSAPPKPSMSWIQKQLQEGQEMTTVKAEIQKLAAAQSDLIPSMFFLNPKTGDYLDIAGREPIAAASTIKLPILIAFFQAVDAGTLSLDEQLVMRQDLVASEAGSMQYQPVGTKFGALETAELMITISDNTATNLLIDRLGGATVLNSRFRSWGLTQTVIRNLLPDLEGTNTISPQDLAVLLLKVNRGELLSLESRNLALDILRQTVTDTLLPQGIGEGASIAHKTGDIGSIIGDAGLIDMPNGQQYAATVMVKRPHNDPRARTLVQQISRLTYQHFSQPPFSETQSSPQETDVGE